MKKIIFAVAILSAAVMTGCSLSFDGTDSSQLRKMFRAVRTL